MSAPMTRHVTTRNVWILAVNINAVRVLNATLSIIELIVDALLELKEIQWYHVSLVYVNTTRIVPTMKPATDSTESADRFATTKRAEQTHIAKVNSINHLATAAMAQMEIRLLSALPKNLHPDPNVPWMLNAHHNSHASTSTARIHAYAPTFAQKIKPAQYWTPSHSER